MSEIAQVDGRTTYASADGTRDAILAAALDLFSELSYEGATTREIAGRAGVTQPLLNYHFRSKEELWYQAVGRVFERLRSALAERADELRDVDELTAARLLLREFVTFSAANPQLHRIITQECKTDGARMDWLVEQHVRPRYDDMATMFARLVQQGLVREIPLPHLYYIVTGAGPTMFVLAPECKRLTGVDPFAPEVIEAHADAVIDLIFGRAERPVSRRREGES